MDIINSLVSSISGGASNNVSDVINSGEQALSAIGNGIVDGATAIYNAGMSAIDSIRNVASGTTASDVSNVIGTASNIVSDTAKVVADTTIAGYNAISNAVNNVVVAGGGFVTGAGATLNTVKDTVVDNTKTIIDDTTNLVKQVVVPVVTAVDNFVNNAWDFLSKVNAQAGAMLANIFEFFWETFIDKLIEAI